jgi:hypothetical protein
MSSDIPGIILQPKCPHCGADLLIEQLGSEPKPDDRVLCPKHGFVGGRDEIAGKTVDQNKEKIGDHIAEQFKKVFRDAGF